MAYHFTEECQDGISLHWSVSRCYISSLKCVKWHITALETVMMTLLYWKV